MIGCLLIRGGLLAGRIGRCWRHRNFRRSCHSRLAGWLGSSWRLGRLARPDLVDERQQRGLDLVGAHLMPVRLDPADQSGAPGARTIAGARRCGAHFQRDRRHLVGERVGLRAANDAAAGRAPSFPVKAVALVGERLDERADGCVAEWRHVVGVKICRAAVQHGVRNAGAAEPVAVGDADRQQEREEMVGAGQHRGLLFDDGMEFGAEIDSSGRLRRAARQTGSSCGCRAGA